MTIYLPDGSTAQKRAILPAGDVKLGDGRLLVNDEPWVNGQHYYHRASKLSVIASIDEHPHYGPLLHVSLALRDSLPSWFDVKSVRDAFFPPDVDCMMILPRAEDYVNLHPHCLHIWQCPEGWGVR